MLPKFKVFSIENAIFILQILSIVFGVTSILFFSVSLSTLNYDDSIQISSSLRNIYNNVGTYSGLYQFTLVIIGFWVTLRRLKLSLDTSDKTEIRESKANKTETLEHCAYFFKDVLIDFNELNKKIGYTNTFSFWGTDKKFTRADLKKTDDLLEEIISINKLHEAEILSTFYKLELFSSMLVIGTLDKDLAKTLIIYPYVVNTTKLYKFMAYHMGSEKSEFMSNTIELCNEWYKEIENKLP